MRGRMVYIENWACGFAVTQKRGCVVQVYRTSIMLEQVGDLHVCRATIANNDTPGLVDALQDT
jgi:hypothetical protein